MNVKEWIEHLQDNPPKGFVVKDIGFDGFSCHNKALGLFVICSVAKEDDGKYWIHVSYSRTSRIPTYEDTAKIKALFIGKDRKAIAVFPEEKNHVNIHPNCLHLWSCDNWSIPEFSKGGMI